MERRLFFRGAAMAALAAALPVVASTRGAQATLLPVKTYPLTAVGLREAEADLHLPDDTERIQRLLDAGGVVHLPASTYRIRGVLTMGSGVTLHGGVGFVGQRL